MIRKQKIEDLEKHIERLRQRDLEISSIALGIHMRQRISQLEDENALLKAAIIEADLEIKNILGTFSWVITRPLRSIRRIVRRVKSYSSSE